MLNQQKVDLAAFGFRPETFLIFPPSKLHLTCLFIYFIGMNLFELRSVFQKFVSNMLRLFSCFFPHPFDFFTVTSNLVKNIHSDTFSLHQTGG